MNGARSRWSSGSLRFRIRASMTTSGRTVATSLIDGVIAYGHRTSALKHVRHVVQTSGAVRRYTIDRRRALEKRISECDGPTRVRRLRAIVQQDMVTGAQQHERDRRAHVADPAHEHQRHGIQASRTARCRHAGQSFRRSTPPLSSRPGKSFIRAMFKASSFAGMNGVSQEVQRASESACSTRALLRCAASATKRGFSVIACSGQPASQSPH